MTDPEKEGDINLEQYNFNPMIVVEGETEYAELLDFRIPSRYGEWRAELHEFISVTEKVVTEIPLID